MLKRIVTAICLVVILGFATTDALAQPQEDQAVKAPCSFTEKMHALDLKLELGLGLAALRGYTQYERGGLFVDASGQATMYPSPLSRLEFPLDVSMLSLTTALKYKNKLSLNFEIRKNLQQSAGSMQDSDWGYWYLDYDGSTPLEHDLSPSSLDIYSESKSSLDVWVLDAKAGYTFLMRPRWSVGTGCGFLYQRFYSDVSDTTQWYPSYTYYFGTAAAVDTFYGSLITYDINYYIPYLFAEAHTDITNLVALAADIAYAPYFAAYDRDHHFIGISGSGSISDAHYTGHALRYGLQCQGRLSPHWVLGMRYESLKMVGDGESKDYSGDGSVYRGKIDQNIESVQKFMNLNLRYCF